MLKYLKNTITLAYCHNTKVMSVWFANDWHLTSDMYYTKIPINSTIVFSTHELSLIYKKVSARPATAWGKKEDTLFLRSITIDDNEKLFNQHTNMNIEFMRMNWKRNVDGVDIPIFTDVTILHRRNKKIDQICQ